VKCPEKYIAVKPPSLSFAEAASIPLAAMTALQALRRYNGDLTGKTVLVPAGCALVNSPNFMCFTNPTIVGGTGLFACQLAKHAFKAGKVITTVSTSKIRKVKQLLGDDTVDESKLSTLWIYENSFGAKIAHLTQLSITPRSIPKMPSNPVRSTSCLIPLDPPWST
jgi:NADPH:quinone reductase-like Zn-dependent oxidoreductase